MPVVLFPFPSLFEVLVLTLFLLEFRVMTLPGSIPLIRWGILVAHFVINGKFQNGYRNKVLLQSRMNTNNSFLFIIGTIAKTTFIAGLDISPPSDLGLNLVIEILTIKTFKNFKKF